MLGNTSVSITNLPNASLRRFSSVRLSFRNYFHYLEWIIQESNLCLLISAIIDPWDSRQVHCSNGMEIDLLYWDPRLAKMLIHWTAETPKIESSIPTRLSNHSQIYLHSFVKKSKRPFSYMYINYVVESIFYFSAVIISEARNWGSIATLSCIKWETLLGTYRNTILYRVFMMILGQEKFQNVKKNTEHRVPPES